MQVLIVSDVHLHPSQPKTAQRFMAFLTGQARQAEAVYILGDLFDAWIGDDDLADPFNAGVCAALHALAQTGTKVFFLPGNRDFLVGADFAAAAGVGLLADETLVDIGGVPTLLLHGDTLCVDDRAYQDFRAVVRTAEWRREFLARPIAERRTAVQAIRARSENEKQRKPMAQMDVNEAAVADAFRRHGVGRIVHGHTHRLARHVHDVDGRVCERWVLGDWDHENRALACDERGCRWLGLDD